MRPATVPAVRALACPNCGAAVELRSHGNAVNAVCPNCLSLLDSRNEGLAIIRKFASEQRFEPLIPLGSRGALQGVSWEAIGFQVRQITVDGVEYRWSEYLLYNPFQGYQYLSEYQGHWNLIRGLRSLPVVGGGARKTARSEGRAYRHFQTADADTIFVLGEFPWQVQSGDRVRVEDYVAPPHVLSAEYTGDEVTWSGGTYIPSTELTRAFGLKKPLPRPQGVYANQPSPWGGRIGSAWKLAGFLVLSLMALAVMLQIAVHGEQVFSHQFQFSTATKGEPAFVTPVFEIHNKANVDVTIRTNLENDWAFFGLALINEEDGTAYDFGKEVSYYYGRDSDGTWTEGDRTGQVMAPAVQPGRYYLRVEPEMDDDGRLHSVNYEIAVKSGAIYGYWIVAAFLLIPLPAVWMTWRAFQFESSRWAESDYGTIFGSSSSKEEDD